MVTIRTKPATLEEWDDVQRALTGGGDGGSCQCIWPMLANKDWNGTTRDDRERMLRTEIADGPPPGIVAYVDGEAAGWVRIGPRSTQVRLTRTRAIVAATPEPLDDDSVWAVSCFSIRREHRGKRVTAALLAAAIDYAKGSGARLLEAYPVDTGGEKGRPNELFHGALSTFEAAGFHQRGELKPCRPLVAVDLTG